MPFTAALVSAGFLSTLSLRRATRLRCKTSGLMWLFLSTLSLRRATSCQNNNLQLMRDFYPRSPCGERLIFTHQHSRLFLFLSTLSLRRATPAIKIVTIAVPNFYPRSPCGERLNVEYDPQPMPKFLSTLSLRRATTGNSSCKFMIAFLSTLSLRRATSIPGAGRIRGPDFYPRSPCGERLSRFRSACCKAMISIHALLAESDMPTTQPLFGIGYFYPRSPCGERRACKPRILLAKNFYPRSPCGERQVLFRQSTQKAIFLSTLSLRRATMGRY